MKDRRAIVFLIFAVVCFALVPLAEPEHQWIAELTGAAYIVLGVGSALDSWSRSRR